MKFSYNILCEMVKMPKKVSVSDLARTLTMSVMEVEEVIDQAKSFDKVVVGLVTAVSQHPNADKLKLAVVDIGAKKMEVVCGGVNLKVDMKVAFAMVGARVKWHGQGELITLEKATIRGVESNGMICAAEELGLSDPKAVSHGIMDLSNLESVPGTPLTEALELNDLIFEIDNKSITHRPDLWGHIGLARELAALWKTELIAPRFFNFSKVEGIDVKVNIQEPTLCQRYLSVVLSGVKVGSSPAWLQNRLLALGMRPINNVVDVANYVMIEMGQPLHTFDLKKIISPEIFVRLAKAGEIITTLDGVVRKLDSTMLVIADKKNPLAIAGIMGGESSMVSEGTIDLLIESGNFNAVSVRKTATKLGLRTDASARFEKALDPALAELAIKRFVYLLQEVCGTIKVASNLVDEYPVPTKVIKIKVTPDWINERLGANLKPKQISDILESLGFVVVVMANSQAMRQSDTSRHSDPPVRRGKSLYNMLRSFASAQDDKNEWEVTVPSWRATRDITIREDLVEEVARIYGYDKIKPVLPKFDAELSVHDEAQARRFKIKEALISAGFTETLSYSFVSTQALHILPDEARVVLPFSIEKLLELVNPVNQTESFLRPGLIPNMISQLIINALHLPHQPVQMFEIGRVFSTTAGKWVTGASKEVLPSQPYHLALAVRLPGNQVAPTYQTLRGALDMISKSLGITFDYIKSSDTTAKIMVSGKQVGGLAVVQFMKSSLKPLVVLAEIDLEGL